MRVFRVKQGESQGRRELAAEVRFEGPDSTIHPLWFRAPGSGELPAAGDPFLPALLIPAMALHEELRIEAPVSAALLAAARDRIVPVVRRFFPEFQEVPIVCDEVVSGPEAPGDGPAAAFFSSGVDSWYTLARNRERLSRLDYVHGFEIDLANRELGERVSRALAEVARRFELATVEIASNLRAVAVDEVTSRLRRLGRPRRQFWVGCYSGSMLVAFGRLLRGQASRILVASSWPWEYLVPNGSHPLIEPGWSTPSLRFELDGLEADRIGKLAALARELPEALLRLRVCNANPSDRLNCGSCWKCIRTRLELRAAGIPEPAGVFPGSVDLAALRRRRLPVDPHFWPAIRRRAHASGDRELERTVEILLGERRHLGRSLEALRLLATRGGRRHLKRYRRHARGPART